MMDSFQFPGSIVGPMADTPHLADKGNERISGMLRCDTKGRPTCLMISERQRDVPRHENAQRRLLLGLSVRQGREESRKKDDDTEPTRRSSIASRHDHQLFFFVITIVPDRSWETFLLPHFTQLVGGFFSCSEIVR
jgi:hypothetical protein